MAHPRARFQKRSTCVCNQYKRHKRARATYRQGPHHDPYCPLWCDPTRVPAHAQQQIDNAETATEYARALLDEDLCNERCE